MSETLSIEAMSEDAQPPEPADITGLLAPLTHEDNNPAISTALKDGAAWALYAVENPKGRGVLAGRPIPAGDPHHAEVKGRQHRPASALKFPARISQV